MRTGHRLSPASGDEAKNRRWRPRSMPKPGECSAAALWGRFGIKNHQTRPLPVPFSLGVPPRQPGRGQKLPASLLNPPEPLRSERHPPVHPINSSCPQGAVRTSIIIKRMMFISGHNVPLLQQAEAEACGVAKVLLAPAMINAAAAHARRGDARAAPRLPARWGEKKKELEPPLRPSACSWKHPWGCKGFASGWTRRGLGPT